jgi:hypothetical protein
VSACTITQLLQPTGRTAGCKLQLQASTVPHGSCSCMQLFRMKARYSEGHMLQHTRPCNPGVHCCTRILHNTGEIWARGSIVNSMGNRQPEHEKSTHNRTFARKTSHQHPHPCGLLSIWHAVLQDNKSTCRRAQQQRTFLRACKPCCTPREKK